MTTYTMLTAIVPAPTASTYRAMASSLHPAGEGMFTTALYSDGSQEPTHYISTGLIDTVFADVVTNPEAFAQVAGVTLTEAQALKGGFAYLAAGTDADEETPAPLHGLAAIDSLGLSLTEMAAQL